MTETEMFLLKKLIRALERLAVALEVFNINRGTTAVNLQSVVPPPIEPPGKIV